MFFASENRIKQVNNDENRKGTHDGYPFYFIATEVHCTCKPPQSELQCNLQGMDSIKPKW